MSKNNGKEWQEDVELFIQGFRSAVRDTIDTGRDIVNSTIVPSFEFVKKSVKFGINLAWTIVCPATINSTRISHKAGSSLDYNERELVMINFIWSLVRPTLSAGSMVAIKSSPALAETLLPSNTVNILAVAFLVYGIDMLANGIYTKGLLNKKG